MSEIMLLGKKKKRVIVDPGNILFLSHFDTEIPYNLVDGKNLIKTGTGTYTQETTKKFGDRALWATRFTVGDVQFPVRERLNPSAWTIEGWVYYGNEGGSGTGRGATHFNLGYNPANGGYGMLLNFAANSGTAFQIRIRSSSTYSGNEQYYATATNSPAAFSKRWGHFALVRDEAVLRAYIGGKLVLSQSGANRPDDSYLNCRLGYTGTFDSCYFDEWRITNNQALYTEDFSPPSGPFTELDVPA